MPSVPPKIKPFSILTKTIEKQTLNFSHSVLFHMKTRVFLIYFVHDCRCFSVNFANFLRKPFFQNTSGRLLLNMQNIFSMFACQIKSGMANFFKKLRNQFALQGILLSIVFFSVLVNYWRLTARIFDKTSISKRF